MSRPLLVAVAAAPTVAELRARRDGLAGADLVELRLDMLTDIDVAGALAGRGTPVVATCRAAWEGGHFKGSEAERRKILECALQLGAEYVDVEFAATFAADLIGSTRGRRIVVSSHDFEGVPPDLDARVRAMRATAAEIVKVAVMARSLADTLALRRVERAANTVLIAMGPFGIPTRLLAAHFGSQWSYAGDGVAPGQISCARMLDEFRFTQVHDGTAVYGVTGGSLGHSISPAMHNAVFAARGEDAIYVPMAAASADDFLAFADALAVKGASVTIPHKVELFARAAATDALSRRVGAINTLRRGPHGWEARNTDVSGFLAPLAARMPLDGARAAILGTGGAARAVAVALGSSGSRVTVYGRNRARAEEVAKLAGGAGAPLPVAPGSWDVLVNATPVGMFPNEDGSPFEGPFDGRVVYDLVYNPAQTRLLREAEAAGCQTIGGLDMLIGQAEDQSAWWLGQRPPAGVMRAAAEAAVGRSVRLPPSREATADHRSLGEGG